MTSVDEPTLCALMAQYQAGSVEAFDRLHDALAPPLKAYLTRLSGDTTRADDLLQETFLQMHRARAAHLPGEPVKPWVFAIAKRVFLMDRRSTGRRARRELLCAPSGEEASSASAPGERLHAREAVTAAMTQVSPDSRRAFVLHHLWGYSFKEIGARLGIKPEAAKIRSSRAMQAMRTLLRRTRDE